MRPLIFTLLFTTIAAAQPAPPAPIQVTRTTAPIALDGKLDDAAWQSAAKIDRFYETSPGDNNPPVVNRELGIRRGVVNATVDVASTLQAAGAQTIVFGGSRTRVYGVGGLSGEGVR